MNMISTIIFVDILFLTFWGTTTSLQSIIWTWAADPLNFDGNLITLAIQSLFSTIAVVGAVIIALRGSQTDTVIFAGFASAVIFNIGKDYLFMYQEVAKINTILATILMVPFLIMFAFIVVEWLRGKD